MKAINYQGRRDTVMRQNGEIDRTNRGTTVEQRKLLKSIGSCNVRKENRELGLEANFNLSRLLRKYCRVRLSTSTARRHVTRVSMHSL